MKKRVAKIHRQTKETDISVELNLDGVGKYELDTGIGFLDHMLTHLSKHGKIDLVVKAKGDLNVDAHHTVEDIAICLGESLLKALGDMGKALVMAVAIVGTDIPSTKGQL